MISFSFKIGVIGMVIVTIGLLLMSSCNDFRNRIENKHLHYYNSNGKKVYLKPRFNRLIVGLTPGKAENVKNLPSKYKNLELLKYQAKDSSNLLIKLNKEFSPSGVDNLIKNLEEESFIQFVYPWYHQLNADRSVVIPTNEIFFAPKSGVSDRQIENVLSAIQANVKKDEQYGNFILRIKKDSDKNIWDIANYLYESGKMNYAYPNFIAEIH